MLQHERNAPIAVTTLADRNASVVAVRTSWRMNLSIVDLAVAASYLEDRPTYYWQNHEDDSQGCDCHDSRIFSIGIRDDDRLYGTGRTHRTSGPLLPVI